VLCCGQRSLTTPSVLLAFLAALGFWSRRAKYLKCLSFQLLEASQMRNSALYGFSISAAAALLAGCGGTQSGIPKAPIIAPDRTDARKAGTTPYFKSLYAFETPAFPAGG
jgi:hypothetical protein